MISKIASKVKGWGLPQKLEEFHPLTEDDGDVLRMRSGRDFNLSFINKLLIRLSKQRSNNYFRNKQAVLSYMTLALMHEMRQPALANNESFNFSLLRNFIISSLRLKARDFISPKGTLKK